ncbi:unnamed protein product [Calypogeia fissa]
MATPTAPGAAPDWKKMKVQELRDELTSRGLDTTGVKSTLIERLETATVKVDDDDATTTADAGGRKDMDLDINVDAPVGQVDEKLPAGEPITTKPLVVAEEMTAEAIPVSSTDDNTPSVDKAAEVSAAPQESPAPKTNGTGVAPPSSDLEKKQRRAERFGLELMVSESEKRRLRAARFGDTLDTKTNGASQDESSKMSPTLKDAEAVKRKARAARFGIEEVGEKPTAASPAGADEAKKKARLARFGLEIKLDPLEQEKKKLRAARFGLTTEAKPEVEPEKKVSVEQPVAT